MCTAAVVGAARGLLLSFRFGAAFLAGLEFRHIQQVISLRETAPAGKVLRSWYYLGRLRNFLDQVGSLRWPLCDDGHFFPGLRLLVPHR